MAAIPVELHIVSDATGETATRLVAALEAQFPEQRFEEVRHPRVETVDDLPDPASLTLTLRVDGVERASGDLSGLGWSFPEMLAHVSKGQDLWPGDVIMAGAVADPCDIGRAPCLDRGAVVEAEAEGLGTLTGTVAATRPPKRFG